MIQKRCSFTNNLLDNVFELVSVGTKGSITELVQYSEIPIKDVYNLGFGDKNEATEFIDNKAITNNQDSNKVLATVASTLCIFTDKYPHAWVYAVGVSPSRT